MTEETKEKSVLLRKLAKVAAIFFAGYMLGVIQTHCNYNNSILACDMPSFGAPNGNTDS